MADHDDEQARQALLAHDLRTPLAAMRLTAELIGNGPLDDSQTEQLAILIRSIDTLTELTGELLSIQTPGEENKAQTRQVADVVRECCDLFQIAAEAKGLSFALVIEDDVDGKLTGLSAALRRLVTTLLDNAVKYTSEGGISVTVNGVPPGDVDASSLGMRNFVSIAVSDTGPGIDPEERARLFRPFVRGRHGRETGPGSGLGLWGAAQIVEEMGGTLELTRPDEGGSRFDLKIPVDVHDEVPMPTADLARKASAALAPVFAQSPSHVLIVDDNETNCRLLSALLESFGISSDTAGSGSQAIGLVQKEAYDAALVDLHMPGMNGVETAQELKRLRPHPDLPLIAVTAAIESIGDENLHRAGFVDVLTKPLSPEALYAAMENALRPGSHHES